MTFTGMVEVDIKTIYPSHTASDFCMILNNPYWSTEEIIFNLLIRNKHDVEMCF
jgi:hypothetical protein